MGSYAQLNKVFMLDAFTIPDLEKLITIEANGRNRPYMLKKIVGRWTAKKREAVYSAIREVVGA